MKIIDYLKYSLSDIIRNKKNFFLILILIMGFLIISCTLTYKNYIEKNVDLHVNNDIGFRTILVESDDEINNMENGEEYFFNRLSKIDSVKEVYNFKYYRYDARNVKEYPDGIIGLLYGSKNTLPKEIYGEKFDDNDTGVAICPLKFNPFYIDDEEKDIQYIDGKKILGTKFTISFDIPQEKNLSSKVYEKQYKIIGLYDAEIKNEYHNMCYISSKDIKELYDTISTRNDEIPTASLIVDDVKNVDKVLLEVNDYGYYAHMQSYIKYDYINNIHNTCNIIVLITSITITLLTILYIKKFNVSRSKKIGIEKTFGFNNKNVYIFGITKTILISLLSTLVGLIIYLLLFNLVSICFESYFFKEVKIFNYTMMSYFAGVIIIICIPVLINIIFDFLMCKKDVSQLLERK